MNARRKYPGLAGPGVFETAARLPWGITYLEAATMPQTLGRYAIRQTVDPPL